MNPIYKPMWEAHKSRAHFHLVEVGAHLPFESGTFAAVTVSLMLHHIPLQAAEAFLAELSRVLAPDGMILIEEQICTGTMQDAMFPLWDETQGCQEAYLSAVAYLPKLGFELEKQELHREVYRYNSGQGVVDDILDCNPQLHALPDLKAREDEVRSVFERVKVPCDEVGYDYRLDMPHRFEVWRKTAAQPEIVFQPNVAGVVDMQAVRLRGRTFTPGSNGVSGVSLPQTLRTPTPVFPLTFGQGPDLSTQSIVEQAKHMRSILDSRLHEVGAVLFTGLPLPGAKSFHDLVAELGYDEWPEYLGGTTIRNGTAVASLEPMNFTIEPHQELSYQAQQPSKFYLYCQEPSEDGSGGESGLTDFRAVTEKMDQSFLAKLKEVGLCYTLRMASKESNEEYPFFWENQIAPTKDATEAWLRENNFSWTWEQDHTLVFKQTLPAVKTHPLTGDDIVMMQPHCFHRSYFDAHPYFASRYPLGTKDVCNLPSSISYGDGQEIPEDVIQAFRRTVYEHTTGIRMRRGDIMVLDNNLCGHSRMSADVRSKRTMLVSMTL
jgi:hypothetical protein